MKKILAVVLSLVLILGILPTGASAAKEENWKEFLLEKLWDVETGAIDISEYNVTYEQISYFLGEEVYYKYPEISYYFSATYEGWIYDAYLKGNTEYAYSFKLNYIYDKATVKNMQKKVDEAIKPVLNSVKKNWSNLETALYLHDWLCTNFMYDLNLWNNPGQENYDMYSFLMEGEGVCQAYALTYLYLLRLCDIESYYVISDEANHGWNVVEIDGNWYHIDVTHDDPVMNMYGSTDVWGKANHNHFMLSDAELEATCKQHSNWNDPLSIVDSCEGYEGNAYWKNISTSIIEIDDWWYYIDNSGNAGGLMRTKDFETAEKIKEIGTYIESWDSYGWNVGSTVYRVYYTGLYELNGHLFFSDSTTIYCYDTHFGRINKVYELNQNNKERFFGIYMDGKTVNYILSENGQFTEIVNGAYTLGVHLKTDWIVVREATETHDGEQIKRCFLCGEVVERQTILAFGGDKYLGDANGNGIVDTSDLAVVKLFLAGSSEEINSFADINKNGVVDTADLGELKLKLSGN